MGANERAASAVASPAGRCYAAGGRPRAKELAMPILIFIVLVVLIAQVGFWDTFSAILGGVAMLVLFVLLAIAFLELAGTLLIRRLRG
jgi:hypothetical protein